MTRRKFWWVLLLPLVIAAAPLPEANEPPALEELTQDGDASATTPAPPAATLDAEPMQAKPVAVLQALDKSTARTARLAVKVGGMVTYGTLFVAARACWQSAPLEAPEAVAFIQAVENKPGSKEPVPVYSGWMYASSPAVAGMEHPVYDITLLGCANSDAPMPPKP